MKEETLLQRLYIAIMFVAAVMALVFAPDYFR